MKNTILRWKNKVRMWFLKTFTNRIKTIKVKDEETGKEFEATVEKQIEKVCDHKSISEIAPTMWKCNGCKDMYFQIGYKVSLDKSQLIGFMKDLAEHLKLEVSDPTEHND